MNSSSGETKNGKELPYYIDSEFNIDCLNYNKIEKIDNGSYSDILSLGDKYVLKKIKSNSSNYLDVVTELDILTNLKHKNIVRSYGFINIDGKIVFILERFQITLDKFKPRSTLETNNIIEQIKNGLLFLHKNMYLHLDLKPENILLSMQNNSINVAITDFSLSRKTKDLTLISDYELITLYYRPYENLRGSMLYSDKSDLWSLGIIIYEMRTGINIYERILPLKRNGEINLETSLLIFLEKQISWGEWPPFECSLLNENPAMRSINQNIISIENNDKYLDNINLLRDIFPVDICIPFLKETNSLYQKISHLLPNDVENKEKLYDKSWFIACFLLIYSNYNKFTKLFTYINYYSFTQIYTILSSGLFGKF